METWENGRKEGFSQVKSLPLHFLYFFNLFPIKETVHLQLFIGVQI